MGKKVLELQTEKLIKKYEKRFAYEWFVRSQDKVHLYLAQEYTDKVYKKITALVVTNAVITGFLGLVIWKHLKCQ